MSVSYTHLDVYKRQAGYDLEENAAHLKEMYQDLIRS